MNAITLRTAEPGFASMLSLSATLMPLLLVAYTFATQTDTVRKAHMIVHGCESIVGALAIVLVLRGVYLLGARKGAALPQTWRIRALETA